jgi:hypothetical protein
LNEPTPIDNDDDRLLKQLLGHYDVLAYVRRARRVQDTFDDLLTRCHKQRDDWLELVRMRLGTLYALAADWSLLEGWLVDERQVKILKELNEFLKPQLRAPVDPTTSAWRLRRAFRELQHSLERFNERWQKFLAELDLSAVNAERDGFNRYYVLEKECAVRSVVVARQGFSRLAPVTTEHIAALLPTLPIPQIRSRRAEPEA